MMNLDINPELVYDATDGDIVIVQGKQFVLEMTLMNDARVFLTAVDPLDFMTPEQWERQAEDYPYLHLRANNGEGSIDRDDIHAVMSCNEMVRRLKDSSYRIG